MFTKNLGLIVPTITCFFCLMGYSSGLIDESCGEGSKAGTCTILSKCPTGVKQVDETNVHSLMRCGFQGLEEIVCCPDFKTNVPKPQQNKTDTDIWGIYRPTETRGSDNDRRSLAACKQFIPGSRTSIGFYILEGENATLGEFPHMAQIGFVSNDFGSDYNWECGGSLISQQFVLTAAHCIAKPDGILPSLVRLGFVDSELVNDTNLQVFGVKNITMHPKYSGRSKVNDIALIELDNKVRLDSNTYPACLYQTDDDPNDLIITGWGNTMARGSAPSRILQKASIEPVQISECTRLFGTRSSVALGITHICCISPPNSSVDTCQGDSGGPLQKSISKSTSLYTIVGVTSYGQGCGGVTPGVYTRVSRYLDWIENIVWP